MRILLAEDEHDLSDALSAILKRNNYSVDQVYNGLDAYEYAFSDTYDGIIMDVMMPKIDGIEATKKIRSKGISTPILMLTAKSEINDKIIGLDVGADDYLTKPFDTGELLARIRAITRRKDNITENILLFGNIGLDKSTYELKGPKDNIRLANKEYQMLEMLMQKPNALISTEQFMDKIWGYDTEAEINVVWVFISNLRKKLVHVGSNVKIVASRGAGYYLK